ncbi:hypothetical protein JXQ31_07195 [candidate division KSB1 bacterium]|nr:hypothetical protein [candidate division KSB1 bacterium]
MLKYSSRGVFLILLLSFSISTAKTFSSHVTDSLIVIDGKDNDWDDSLIYYVEDLDGVTGIVTDDSSLTIMFRFSDPELHRKIMFGGATLWWNAEGKKKKEFGVRFPSTFTPGSFREMAELRGNMEQNMEMTSQPMQLISPVFWDKITDKKYSWSEINGMAASASMANKIICYEFRIPLNNKNPYALNVKPGKKFRLGLELGGLENKKELQKQMESGDRPSDMGGRGGGMGGPGGGMGHPGGRGGGMGANGGRMGGPPNMNDMFESEEIWLSVKLNDNR